MTFTKTITVTEISFGFIKNDRIIKGKEVFVGKKTLERVRASLRKKYGILIEPKVKHINKTYQFDLRDGIEIKQKKGK